MVLPTVGCLSQSAWPRRADIDILLRNEDMFSCATQLLHLTSVNLLAAATANAPRLVSSFSSPSIESPDPRFTFLSLV